MIDLKEIRSAAEAAPYEAPWRYEPTGQTVWAGSTYMVADVRGWGHLQYLPNGEALQDATGVHIATADPATVIALCDEIERLRKEGECLLSLDSAEKLLEEIERLRKDAGRLDFYAENSHKVVTVANTWYHRRGYGQTARKAPSFRDAIDAAKEASK